MAPPRVQNSVHIQTDKMASAYKGAPPMVEPSVWREVMKLTGKRLRGVQIVSRTKVQIDAESLTDEARRRLRIGPKQ